MEIGSLNHVSDYREFLRQVFHQKKKINPRFSLRRFAEIVGFKSPNYLQLILEGKRNLSTDTAGLIAVRLKLPPGDREYFVSLVQAANAKNDRERQQAERARLVALKKIVSKEIPSAKKEVFSRWFCLLVRELFLIPKAKADPKWIVERLNGCITETEAANAVEMLCRTGFLIPTEDGYKPADPVLDTNDDAMSAAFMRQCHAETLAVWSKNLDQLGPADQELGILNIPISSARIPELRDRIRKFQDEILGLVQDEKEADTVIQLGTYLIPFK